jgi:hypothetical protein
VVSHDGPRALDPGPDEHRRTLALLVAVLSTRPQQDWALYAAHRARLTEAVLASAATPGGRLCVLGAGSCNDLDLERLAEVFTEIHLVDLDAKALARAVARQPAAVRARLRRHAPVDLSGLSARRLDRWKRVAPDLAEIEGAAASALDRILARFDAPFELVVSTCVLTQMAFALGEALGPRHPALEPVRLALMRTHLSTLVDLTASGGTALFASDLVSSTSYALDDLPPGRALIDVMRDAVTTGACYYAANPEIVGGLLAEVGAPELLEPWLWTGPLRRTYLVYALRLRVPFDAEG